MEITQQDAQQICEGLGELIEKFEGKKILITGYAGFLGSQFTCFFNHLNQSVLKEKCQVTCIDSKIVELEDVSSQYTQDFEVIHGDVTEKLPHTEFDYIIHCAGIASPTFYRRFPLETINVNSIGYWNLLNKLENSKALKGFLYFSTSEIYGNPTAENIPTPEEYNGNVSCTGPRASYDESKRLGETISINYATQKNLPIKLVRPFNFYGPFMRLNDKRVIPDFVKTGLENNKIEILSDGKPTRSFCYTTDAIEGCIKVLLIGEVARPYNIGNDTQEISMRDLAEMVSEILGSVEVTYQTSQEEAYLVDNPQRRCPILTRAKEELNYQPKVPAKEGLKRMINWYREVYQL